jgi:hypothetical protein
LLWVTYPEEKKSGLIVMSDLPGWQDERWSHYDGRPTQMIECDLPGKKTRLEKSWQDKADKLGAFWLQGWLEDSSWWQGWSPHFFKISLSAWFISFFSHSRI